MVFNSFTELVGKVFFLFKPWLQLHFLIAFKYYSKSSIIEGKCYCFPFLQSRKLKKDDICKGCVDKKKYYTLVSKLSIQMMEVLDDESIVELRHASHQAIVVGGAILNQNCKCKMAARSERYRATRLLESSGRREDGY